MENMGLTYFTAGGLLMWPLALCSVVSLTIILERLWFWCRLNFKQDEKNCSRILANWPNVVANDAKGLLSGLVLTGLQAGRRNCDQAMEIYSLEALACMRKGLNILDTIITAAPMLVSNFKNYDTNLFYITVCIL